MERTDRRRDSERNRRAGVSKLVPLSLSKGRGEVADRTIPYGGCDDHRCQFFESEVDR